MILTHHFRCGQCGLDGPQNGFRYRRVNGVRTKVCGPCAERLALPVAEKEKVAA